MTNVAKLFISCLEAHDVKYIFAVPGEENLDMVEAIRVSTIQLIVTRSEQTAVFMAATHGRLTGKIGVAMATLGPGATNTMTGTAYAQLGGMPVLIITGQKPIKKSKQGRFQVLDVVSMMKPITKYSTSIVDASRVPSTIAHAIMMAEEEKPGAVHIELAEDVAREEAEGYQPIVFDKIRRPIADPKAIDAIVSYLEQAYRPMILIGAGSNRKRVSKYLAKLIQKYNIPFFTSQMGKGVVDERLTQYIGTAALTSGDYVHDVIDQSDLILAIGHDTIEKPTHVVEAGRAKVIHINFTAAQVDELYKPELQVIGDIGNTLWQLHEREIDSSSWKFDSVYEVATKARAQLETNVDTMCCSDGLSPARLIRELRSHVGDEDIVALDNGLYKVWFARNYLSYAPNTLLLDNALATMGAGYSSAMMAKIVYPKKEVVAVVGDGGLMMNLGDLATIIDLALDVTIIVLNDQSYGMIKRKQKNMGLADFSLDLYNPDFIKLAESFGATAYKVATLGELQQSLSAAQKISGLKLIEVAIVYPDKIQ